MTIAPACASPVAAAWPFGMPHNTLVVVAAVSAVGFAAGMVGALSVLRKRPLVGDAAAHATLLGAAGAFLATGCRDLPTLLAGALASAVAAAILPVLVRRFTRTRDDAATAIVIGVSFGAGVAVVTGINARGLPGGGGLEQLLLGHAAGLTAGDATLLAAASLVAVMVVVLAAKEFALVAFDPAFAAASGRPVVLIDCVLVAVVAVMVVAGLPAVGAVLVTALLIIPPVAARQWTDQVWGMLVVSGFVGLVAGVAGVAASTARPGLSTGPLVVLAAAAICLVSCLAAPRRGWLVRRWREAAASRRWERGRLLTGCLAAAGPDGAGAFGVAELLVRLGGDGPAARRRMRRACDTLVREGGLEPSPPGEHRWRLSAAGLAEARERGRRVAAWRAALDSADEARDRFTLALPPACADGASDRLPAAGNAAAHAAIPPPDDARRP